MSFFRSLFGGSDGQLSRREAKLQEKLETKYGMESGGCSRPDSLVEAGWATCRGKRSINEDTFYCSFHHDDQDNVDVGCFGVFDGHGGPMAARFVRDHLFHNLLGHEHFSSNLMKALEDAYQETDSQYLEVDEEHQRDDGCTAVTAVLVGNKLAVAHVGDSRAVISVGHGAQALSRDHKPNRADERGRIENAGGAVVWAGTWRVGGVLAVSRSFGNRMMKQFIIPHPEIWQDHITHENRVLVLASDGLWDAMDNEEATRLALKQRPGGAAAAARALIGEAYSRGSADNITAVVIFFRSPPAPSAG